MEHQPLVSVIINCYNGEKYLREAIDSVIAQTYTNWELIFWDNQSTDSTAEIVKSYKDDRIRYFYAPEHTPLGEARNLAMKETFGEYIGFLDADDVWNQCFLFRCVEILNKFTDVSFVYSGCSYIGEKSGEYRSGEAGFRDISSLLINYDVAMSGAVFRSELANFGGVSFNPNYNLIEDFDFYIRLARISYSYHIKEVLVSYRIHSGNLSNNNEMGWYCEKSAFLRWAKSNLTERELKENSHGLNVFEKSLNSYLFFNAFKNEQSFFQCLSYIFRIPYLRMRLGCLKILIRRKLLSFK